MPINLWELIVGISIPIVIGIIVISLNKRKRRSGWIFLLGVLILLIIGNLVELFSN